MCRGGGWRRPTRSSSRQFVPLPPSCTRPALSNSDRAVPAAAGTYLSTGSVRSPLQKVVRLLDAPPVILRRGPG